jgi:hypothetical protein
MKMKKKFALLVAGIMTMSMVASANAAISVNGKVVEADAVVSDGEVFVPFRDVMEGLGADIAWDGETKTATATIGDVVAAVHVGIDNIQLIEDKIYIPASTIKNVADTVVNVDEDGNVDIALADFVASDSAVSAEAVEVVEEETEETTEETTVVEEVTEETTDEGVLTDEYTEDDEEQTEAVTEAETEVETVAVARRGHSGRK